MILIKILIPASSFDLCRILSGQVLINQKIFDHCSIIKLPPAILYFWVEFAQLMETVRVKQLGRTDQWDRSKPVTWSELTNRRSGRDCIDNTPAITDSQKMTLLAKSGLNQKLTGPSFFSLSHYFEDKTHWVHSLFYKQRSPSKYFHCRKYSSCQTKYFLVIQVLGHLWPELADN